jgi:hypothetical protein
MYTRFPSMTSTKSSAVQSGSRMATSALASLYSLSTALISSWSMFVRGTVLVIAIPPLSFLRTVMLGGFLFKRIPKPSSSCSIMRLSLSGLRTSRTMKMRLHVRATRYRSSERWWLCRLYGSSGSPAMTCRPRPRPSFAPSMIPAGTEHQAVFWVSLVHPLRRSII